MYSYYTIPNDIYMTLVAKIGEEEAKKLAEGIELFLKIIVDEAKRITTEQRESLKAEVYNELRKELASEEFVEAKINDVRAEIAEVRAEIAEVRTEIAEVKAELELKIESVKNELELKIENLSAEVKQNGLLLKVLIGISIFGMTLMNPNFAKLIEKIFG